MSDSLLSVGLDVGTTSTQLVVSRLTVGNRASSFAVPDMDLTERTVLYKSPVYFTPLLGENLVDGSAIREIVQKEYQNAGIHREDVDTGAIIITGETSREENARVNGEGDLSGVSDELLLKAVAGSVVNYANTIARYDSGMLDEVFSDAVSMARVFYLAFDDTVPAGGSVSVTAAMRK